MVQGPQQQQASGLLVFNPLGHNLGPKKAVKAFKSWARQGKSLVKSERMT